MTTSAEAKTSDGTERAEIAAATLISFVDESAIVGSTNESASSSNCVDEMSLDSLVFDGDVNDESMAMNG